ncbi:MAG: hypothetical protein PHR25_03025 [Clostridia bacterium]|nr:hypothetical protein [Clostridia bacterium]MDD4375733.1 hypothetical protein [Clostridia bacterium]
MKTNKRKGISLIVLVITIIVMIILAGAIILSLNSSGIIARAEEAKMKSDKANAKQVAVLARAEYELMSDAEKEEITLIKYIENRLSEAGFKKSEYNVTEKGTVYDIKSIIPEGFYHVGGTVEEGLIISDNIEDEGQGTSHNIAEGLKGNQFVWVPVENINEFIRYDFRNDQAPKNDLYEITPETGKDREVEKMYASVEKYKGFYIGRYEAGIAEGMQAPTETTINDADGTKKPRIRQGIAVWNYIPWGGTQDDTAYDWFAGDDNANGAVKVARSLYPDNSQNTRGVVSHLIYGVQWDAVMRWYKASGINVKDSSEYGNYLGGGGLKVTGSEATYQKKNIYDLAGNVYEWTMEAYSWNGRVGFGGAYASRGSIAPVSSRSLYSLPYVAGDNKGLRIVAYIK